MNSNRGAVDCPPLPEIVSLLYEEWAGAISLSVSIIEGPTLNLWSIATAIEGSTEGELRLQLQPDQAVVIGRQEGGQIEYLDPRFHPTPMLPNTSRRVATLFCRETEKCVSRGHFMLKGSLHGILLVNGVPRRGGGIRPPLNGTLMLEPQWCLMKQGEEYMIERGATAKIRLPNGTVILVRAE
jgi:hypothetical protein